MTSVKVTPDSPPEAAQIPSFKTTVHFMRKRFITVIQLHNIPDKHIDLEVTPTHFSLNTFKYSKKFFLKFRYPTKIKVDENDVEVDLSGGVLTVTLKIVQILNEETGKLMAFKGKTKSSGQPSATKKSAPKPESSSEEMDVSEDGAEESEDEQVSEEEEEKPKRKSKAPTTRASELKILEEVAAAEESKRTRKLKDETAKEAFFTKKTAEKEALKERKKAAKEATIKKLVAAHEAERQASKPESKKSKRTVQFEDDEETEAPPAKKAKGKGSR